MSLSFPDTGISCVTLSEESSFSTTVYPLVILWLHAFPKSVAAIAALTVMHLLGTMLASHVVIPLPRFPPFSLLSHIVSHTVVKALAVMSLLGMMSSQSCGSPPGSPPHEQTSEVLQLPPPQPYTHQKTHGGCPYITAIRPVILEKRSCQKDFPWGE